MIWGRGETPYNLKLQGRCKFDTDPGEVDTFAEGKITKLWEAIYFVFITVCESGGAGWKRWSALSTRFYFLTANVPHVLISHFLSSSRNETHHGFLLQNSKKTKKQNKTRQEIIRKNKPSCSFELWRNLSCIRLRDIIQLGMRHETVMKTFMLASYWHQKHLPTNL